MSLRQGYDSRARLWAAPRDEPLGATDKRVFELTRVSDRLIMLEHGQPSKTRADRGTHLGTYLFGDIFEHAQ